MEPNDSKLQGIISCFDQICNVRFFYFFTLLDENEGNSCEYEENFPNIVALSLLKITRTTQWSWEVYRSRPTVQMYFLNVYRSACTIDDASVSAFHKYFKRKRWVCRKRVHIRKREASKDNWRLSFKEVGYNFVLFFLGPMLQFMWDLVKHFSTELKMGLTQLTVVCDCIVGNACISD